ncbi:MAG: deoxyguanosinetriphosphate triphosphohydrolase [Firmicutes bacterium]|nr:deoxyguanosinetriphosphate triphosphohydrolase [Bacillota bacterium]
MRLRLEIEEWEEKYLSPYAALSSKSQGRIHPEAECEVRTAFQRDRDRIIHSKAFRRLKSKTQVFISPKGDHYRTRLTHTLEVAQISRTVARALRLNEDLVEAIALAHDLGHTPFGHAGEAALSRLTGQFAHNEQSLRVVDFLERQEHRQPGLNLTAEVRDGIVGHTGQHKPQTLEGQVVRICDRVAYLNHDIEDAIRGEIIREDELPDEVIQILGISRSKRIDTMVKDIIINSEGKPEVAMSPAVAKATETLRNFLFEKVYIGSAAKEEEVKVYNVIKMLYEHYLANPQEIAGFSDENALIERQVVDYIAGMTDVFAVSEFQKLFLPKGWAQH